MSGAESFGGDAVVAVLTHIALLGMLASFVGEVAVVVSVAGVMDCVAVYALISASVSSVESAAVVTALGGGIAKVVILAFRVLDAVIMAFRAAIFMSRLNVFSHRFFFWECFPCPGPGILNVIDNKKS